MALIDKASLLMVPSTYEAGTLYNVLPSGNRAPDNKGGAGYDQTRADFDFDRGSNAAATRVNASGLIEKYRENLLLQSNQFNTTWLNQLGGTITGGQSGYDGSNDAWLISKDTSTFRSIRQVVSWGGVSTFSVYAKVGTLSNAALRLDTSAGVIQILYDLTNGSVTSAGGIYIDAGSDDIGGGWYRLYVSANVSSGTNVHIFVDRDGTTAGNIYIQDAQLEQGLVATAVLTSGATTGKAGVLVDLPRINYDANGENGALLLEPSRQNLIPNSEYLGDWSLTNGTLTTNATISPDGTQNAGRVVFSANGLDLKRTISVSASTTYTYTFYIKLESGTGLQGRFYDNSNSANIEYYDFTNQISGTDWSRITRTFTTPSGCTEIQVWLLAASSSLVTASFWGAQLEPNATYPSSYIPTMGTSETRAADSCSVTGASDVIGGTSGTIFFDVVMNESLTNTNYKQFFYYTDSGANQTYMFVAATNYIVGNARLGNITSSTQLQAGERYKIAVTYATNSFKMYINGSEDATSSSGTPIDNENILSIGSYSGTSEFNEFVFKQYAHFKEVLSDSELATLTTL